MTQNFNIAHTINFYNVPQQLLRFFCPYKYISPSTYRSMYRLAILLNLFWEIHL